MIRSSVGGKPENPDGILSKSASNHLKILSANLGNLPHYFFHILRLASLPSVWNGRDKWRVCFRKYPI